MADLVVRAPAKINLHLGVGGPRPDGFHPLETVYTSIGLYDDLRVRAAQDWSLSLEPTATHVEAEAVPLGADNIVDRAARLLAAEHGVPVTGEVHILKGIPVAGGLAGGSADAAAALVALDRLWGLHTPDEVLLRLAGELGSDVPFGLLGGHGLGTGRGELVEPVPVGAATLWWVVVPASTGLSTPAVYRHFDELHPEASDPTPAAPVLKALAADDVVALAAALHNDLQPAAFDLRPELARLIAEGESEGALRGLVSGSGPTCVFLCEGADAARAVAGALRTSYDVALVANGPVAGAHVVADG